MGNYPTYRPKERLPTRNDTQTKAPDRTQKKTHFTTRQKKQEMGEFHIHFPTNMQDHELVQEHKHKDNT